MGCGPFAVGSRLKPVSNASDWAFAFVALLLIPAVAAGCLLSSLLPAGIFIGVFGGAFFVFYLISRRAQVWQHPAGEFVR